LKQAIYSYYVIKNGESVNYWFFFFLF
jgi:hypothetical protein